MRQLSWVCQLHDQSAPNGSNSMPKTQNPKARHILKAETKTLILNPEPKTLKPKNPEPTPLNAPNPEPETPNLKHLEYPYKNP